MEMVGLEHDLVLVFSFNEVEDSECGRFGRGEWIMLNVVMNAWDLRPI